MKLSLPHWALIALGAAGAVVTYLMHVPAMPSGVLGALSIAQIVLGMLSGSALSQKGGK